MNRYLAALEQHSCHNPCNFGSRQAPWVVRWVIGHVVSLKQTFYTTTSDATVIISPPILSAIGVWLKPPMSEIRQDYSSIPEV